MNKASGGDGIPAELFQILKDDAVKEPQSIYWQKMFKILQTRLQQYVNRELPDVQARFRKGRGTRDQIANIHSIIEKVRVPENTKER